MKKIFIFLYLLVIFHSCQYKNPQNSNVSSQYYQNPNDNLCFFILDNRFTSIKHWDSCQFVTYYSGDSIKCSQDNKIFFRQNVEMHPLYVDTITIANSWNELYDKHSCWLFNIKIWGRIWNVSLYYPFDNTKGTYRFEISDEEQSLFNGILSKLLNSKVDLYPAQDTSKTSIHGPIPATYVSIKKNNKIREIFGSIENAQISALTQIVIVLNQKYISHETKKNDTISFNDVRSRFNDFSERDRHTGSYIEDFDSVMKKIAPISVKKND